MDSIAVVRGVRWRGALLALLLATSLLALSAIATTGAARADNPSASASASSGRVLVVRMGDRGRAIRRIQRRLRISADGIFGRGTKRAVRRFQRRKRLEVDGIVGPKTRRALRLRPFSRRSVRSPRRRSRSRPHRHGGSPEVPEVLEQIAECESGGDPTAVSASGRYRGKYQFSRATWERHGGSGDPAEASEAEQDRIALRLYRARGTDPWPTCGRKRG